MQKFLTWKKKKKGSLLLEFFSCFGAHDVSVFFTYITLTLWACNVSKPSRIFVRVAYVLKHSRIIKQILPYATCISPFFTWNNKIIYVPILLGMGICFMNEWMNHGYVVGRWNVHSTPYSFMSGSSLSIEFQVLNWLLLWYTETAYDSWNLLVLKWKWIHPRTCTTWKQSHKSIEVGQPTTELCFGCGFVCGGTGTGTGTSITYYYISYSLTTEQ